MVQAHQKSPHQPATRYIIMRQASNDLRVRRTIKSIKYAFCQLVLEKDYNDISITQLAERAEINRKTFYLHFSSLDDLVEQLQHEIVDNFLDYVEPEINELDVAGCISKFYHYLDECDDVEQKLLCDPNYVFFYNNVTNMLLETSAFKPFYENAKHPFVVRAYCVTITSIYRSWLQNDKPTTIDELVDYASDLIVNGYGHADL